MVKKKKKVVKKVMRKPVIKKLVKKKVVKKVVKKKIVPRKKVILRKIKEKKVKNVKKISGKKSKKILKRAGMGIQNFDKMIGGGFERESLNLVVGDSGSGKSIFALQFLIEGLKKGEKSLYVSFEEKKEAFYENMKKLGWDLERAEKSGKFIFLESSPEKVKMMLDEGGGAIESVVLKHGIKRMIVDSITSFSLLFDDKLSKRQALLSLFDIIRKWSCTTFFTVQHTAGDNAGDGFSSIEFEADSIIFLYYVNVKNKRERFIEVFKMRGVNHSKEIYSFSIDKGIKVGKKARVKSEVFR